MVSTLKRIFGEKEVNCTEKLLFVTDEERKEHDKAENLSIKELTKRIKDLIQRFPEVQQITLHKIFEKTVKNKSKKDYISFYNEKQSLYTELGI